MGVSVAQFLRDESATTALHRRRVWREVADVEHRPQHFGLRQDRLRLRALTLLLGSGVI
jgi:hypothetical protein